MSVIEQILSTIAPFHCSECGQEGQILCGLCSQNVFPHGLPGCGMCGTVTNDGLICSLCRASTPLTHVWVLGEYEGTIQKLVHSLKFAHARATADVFADAMARHIPYFASNPLVVPLPTAPSRIRQRGYDQTVLLAKALAKRRNFRLAPLLIRQHYRRQVGSTRVERWQFANAAYRAEKRATKDSPPILLVDDVMTTGASLNAAAKVLHGAGYSNIMAIVVAKQAFKG